MWRDASANQPRINELILGGYFAYTSVLAFVLPVSPYVTALTLIANLVALGALHSLTRLPPQRLTSSLRSLVPIGCVVLAYQQMGWFAQPQESIELELAWVGWDRLLLVDWGFSRAIETAGPFLPGLLELLYLSTYALAPVSLLVLVAKGRMARADRFLAIYVASALASYALFPYFPSEPPRVVFPGELGPGYDTAFRRLNWWLLGGAGIHTSVFPSGHVSSAFGAAFGLFHALPEHRRYGAIMMAVACGIGVATVYGRYHYAVDALAGLIVSVVATLVCCHFLYKRKQALA